MKTAGRILKMNAIARPSAGGFTLVEVMFTCGIGAIIAMVTMIGLIEGSQLFRSNSAEIVARDKGSIAIRKISAAVQQASQVSIYPSYLSTTGSSTTYGSCALLTSTTGTVAYYRYAATSDSNSGGLYYCTSSTPNPANDQLLVSNVQDFEFRSDVSGSVRSAFKVAIYGFPNLALGFNESNIVRYSTSNVPRN
jgi:type II secretory pathway pseudopilin PulG